MNNRSGSLWLMLVTFAILVATVMSCGDDDDGASTLSPSSEASATASPSNATSRPSDNVISADFVELQDAGLIFTARIAGDGEALSGGANVALGDFNGDGETDLLLGAQQGDGPDDSRLDAGDAYVIFGPLAGEFDLATQDPDITIYGQSAGDNLGYSVMAGDLNDDGIDDIFVGAPGVTAGFDPRTDQGRIYVFYGGGDLGEITVLDLAEDVFDLTVTGAEGFSRLGTTMGLGDVNGDGRTDLVAGSPFAGRAEGSPPGSQRLTIGEVYVIYGQDELVGERNIAALEYNVLIAGEYERGEFGETVAVADFNDDGIDDILVGAQRTDPTGERDSGGAAYIFFGDQGLDRRLEIAKGDADAVILGPSAGAGFGFPAAAGDVNGDSIADAIVGAQTEADGTHLAAGKVRVFYGPDFDHEIDLTATVASLTIAGHAAGLLLPTSEIAADLDGDGYDELLVASTVGGSNLGRSGGGLVFTLRGSSEHEASISTRGAGFTPTIAGTHADASLGASMASGLINGVPVIAILAPHAMANGTDDTLGAIYVLTGALD